MKILELPASNEDFGYVLAEVATHDCEPPSATAHTLSFASPVSKVPAVRAATLITAAVATSNVPSTALRPKMIAAPATRSPNPTPSFVFEFIVDGKDRSTMGPVPEYARLEVSQTGTVPATCAEQQLSDGEAE